jgi:phosphoglycolate phosphatase-like HAD superfamily hydrolase
MRRAFREQLGRDDVLDFGFGGLTDRAIVRAGLSQAGHAVDAARIDALIECYLGHLPEALSRAESYSVMPGVVELLDEIADQRELAVGLGTGNVRRGAEAKLARGQLCARFTFGGFGCDHEDRAMLLAVGAERGARALGASRSECRVVVIGDTPRDVAAASAIGAECLAVTTGASSGEELAAATLCVADLTAAEARAWLLEST